jgi:hypothetical protein
MPTGYTAIIEEKNATFEEFVWRCARAFGALITMRDEPLDAPLPDRIEPSTVAEKLLAEAKAEVARFEAMTAEEAEKAAFADYTARATEYREAAARAADLRTRYASMRARVADWQPPTHEHEGLKKFMVDQLGLCSRDGFGPWGAPPALETGGAWRIRRLTQAVRDVERYEQSVREECERTESRCHWLAALRESVPPPTPTPTPAEPVETKR